MITGKTVSWDNWLWNDLQGRIHITDLPPQEIEKKVENLGLDTAKNVFEEAKVFSGSYEEWKIKSLKITDAPTHFILMKRLNFYYRRLDNKTVVFVFLYADDFDKTIGEILNSFEWSNKQT